ncbi:hypothetical protein AAF712_016349 [Marasmius tenuissimus]|uniref:Retrotransposon gag domain-containing protein n=1 Tax=Marasmius tenuissimus TaxID=585030 RepID=A0ABR2Z5X8_9AGAR
MSDNTENPQQPQPIEDPVTAHLINEQQNLFSPNLEHANCCQLLWAPFWTLLPWIQSIAHASGNTSTATERISGNIDKFTNREPKLDISPPEKFAGSPEKVDAFVNALVLYFKGKKIKTDEGRIIYALSMVVGGTNDVATNWADLQQKLIIEEDDSRLKTWKDFCDALVSYFKYLSTIDELQTKLTNLKQGKGTADEFITQFKAIMGGTAFDDEALLYWFKLGLNNGLRKLVWSLRPMLTTLKEWMNKVSNQNHTYCMDQEYQAHKRGSGSAQTGKANKTPVNNHAVATRKTIEVKRETVTTTPDPNAMDIDVMKKKGQC